MHDIRCEVQIRCLLLVQVFYHFSAILCRRHTRGLVVAMCGVSGVFSVLGDLVRRVPKPITKEELSDPRFRCSLRDRACALRVSTNFVLKSLPTAPDSTNSTPTFRVILTHGNCVTRVTPLILRGVNCTDVTGILITPRRRTVPSTRDSLRLPRMSWSLLGLLATVGWPACFYPLRLPLGFLDVA